MLFFLQMSKLLTSAKICLLGLLTPSSAFAQGRIIEEECRGDNCYAPLTELEIIFSNILNVITILAGFAVLLMLVIGAFRYMVAQGDPKAVSTARSHLTWSILGLVFIVVAWLVILFMEQFTGVNLTTFTITEPPPRP